MSNENENGKVACFSDEEMKAADAFMTKTGVTKPKHERQVLKTALADIKEQAFDDKSTRAEIEDKLRALRLLTLIISEREIARGRDAMTDKLKPLMNQAAHFLIAGDKAAAVAKALAALTSTKEEVEQEAESEDEIARGAIHKLFSSFHIPVAAQQRVELGVLSNAVDAVLSQEAAKDAPDAENKLKVGLTALGVLLVVIAERAIERGEKEPTGKMKEAINTAQLLLKSGEETGLIG